MKTQSLNSMRRFFFTICVAVCLLACPIKSSMATVNPDLLNQLEEFESLLKNASGDIAQLEALIQKKITLFPNDAPFIAALASCCVPDRAEGIAKIAVTQTPNLSIEIAFAVTYVVPESAEKIKAICIGISLENAAEISIAVEMATEKRKSADLSRQTNKELALAAVAAAEMFMEDMPVPVAPIKGYGS